MHYHCLSMTPYSATSYAITVMPQTRQNGLNLDNKGNVTCLILPMSETFRKDGK
jgi:hypothetical protein